MDSQPSLPNQPHKGGVPYWIALVVLALLLILVVAGIGGTYYYLRSDQLRLARETEAAQQEAKRKELVAQEAIANAQAVTARNQQDQLLTEVRAVTNALTQLLAACDAVRAESAALRTNEAGRRVALHPELVTVARRFYEASLSQVPPEPELTTRLEAVRRIEQQLLASYGKAYELPAGLVDNVQSADAWVRQAQIKVEPARQTLAALVADSQVKFTRATLTAESPTLAVAIARFGEQEAAAQLRQGEAVLSSARTNATVEIATAQAQQIVADAKRQAAEILQQSQEAQAAKERDLAEREAKLKLAASQTKVVVQNTVDAARNVELKKKASDPALQAKLAPFITPGYKGVIQESYDLKPLSYTELQSAGALTPTVQGLDKLVFIGTNLSDRVRPRWKINRVLYRKHNDELAMVKEVQQLLIELGPVLVEMKLLEP